MNAQTPDSLTIDYSIIIPAWNEQELLVNTLSHIKTAMKVTPLSGEVIVVDNNSTDATAHIAQSQGVHVVFEPVNQISRARNRGAKEAQGKYLVFIDADTRLTPQLLSIVLSNLQSDKCSGGGAVVRFDESGSWFARYGVRLWNCLAHILGLAAGCFVYCRRDAYDDIGGFSEKVYASEEIWFSRGLRLWGKRYQKRFCLIREVEVLSSSRKLQWFNPLQQMFLVVMLTIFPFAVRFKWLCGFWYKRPEKH